MVWKLSKPKGYKKIETKNPKEVSKLKKIGYLERKLKSGKFILRKKLEKWEYFQEKIRCFLEALGFEDVESGPTSWLGRYQVDVVGGYDGTFVVFECKSSTQPKLKKITQEINIFSGKKAEIQEAIREKFRAKYNEVKFVLAVEDIDITLEDRKTAKENDIYLWGDSYIEAASNLYELIGPLTVHYILKELNVAPKLIKDDEGGADYKVPAFRVSFGEQKVYSFFLPAEKLLNLVYVFRLQPGNEDAYQRFINKKRILGAGGITEFINNGGFFKNTVVCAFERPVNFEPKPTGLLLKPFNIEFGILSIPKLYGTVWVIDGQHRIYGYAGANPEARKTNIGIVAYQDIEKKQQARDFIDINQKQKSVDPNTLWTLLSQTDPDSLQGAITKVAKELNKKGIFEAQIYIPGEAHRKRSSYPLKLANVCNGLRDRKLLDSDVRDNLYIRTEEVTDQRQYPDSVISYAANILDQYFSLIWEIAEDTPAWRKGFILHNNGFNVFLRVLVEILKYERGSWNKSNVKRLLEDPLKLYFEENYDRLKEIRQSTSNEAGRGRIALEIIKQINQKETTFADKFIKEAEKRERQEFEKSEPYQILKELENNLRIFIERELKKVSKNWWKQRIPIDVQENAQQRFKKNESPWPWVKSEEKTKIFYVDFPDYAKIIQRRDNWSDVFAKFFKDPTIIGSKLRELEPIRNSIAHMRNISPQEFTTLRLYATQILNIIKKDSEK